MKKEDNPFLNGLIVTDPYPKTESLKEFDSNGELDILEEIKNEICEKLGERMRDTAYSTSSDSYLVKSLVDRGLADSRALPIANALRDGDMNALAFAVCACDEWNFPHLLKIEPRIFWMLLVNETDPVLIQRLEEVMK